MSLMKKSNIYFCGDTHGSIDLAKLENFFDDHKDKISKNDFMIQLGDFGFIWKSLDDEKQRVSLEYLASQDITFCVVLGNHENYNEIEKLPKIEKFGGKVRVLKLAAGELYFFERGEIYDIADQKIFAFGGALSIDKKYRVLNQSYWKQELPTQMEYDNALNNLEKHNFQVDIVVSHTCPRVLIGNLGFVDAKINDPVTGFFDHLLIDKKIQFNEWRFGHFHVDRHFRYEDKMFQCHYEDITETFSEDMLVKIDTKTYFGLSVYDYKGVLGVLMSDIKTLPFFEYWQQSSLGSTCMQIQNGVETDTLVYLYDWVNFSKLFILMPSKR